jgi:hypothetical protein
VCSIIVCIDHDIELSGLHIVVPTATTSQSNTVVITVVVVSSGTVVNVIVNVCIIVIVIDRSNSVATHINVTHDRVDLVPSLTSVFTIDISRRPTTNSQHQQRRSSTNNSNDTIDQNTHTINQNLDAFCIQPTTSRSTTTTNSPNHCAVDRHYDSITTIVHGIDLVHKRRSRSQLVNRTFSSTTSTSAIGQSAASPARPPCHPPSPPPSTRQVGRL